MGEIAPSNLPISVELSQNEYSSRAIMCRMNSVLEAQASYFTSSPVPRRAGEEMRKVIYLRRPSPCGDGSPPGGCVVFRERRPVDEG